VNRFLTIVLTAVAGLVLVACGPAASSSSSGPSSAASVSASSSDIAVPSFTEGAVADLEALIPDMVGTLNLRKTSMAGSEFLVGQDDPATTKFIEDLGVSPSAISIAVGTGSSTDGSARLVIIAFRAAGTSTDRLLSGFKEAIGAQPESSFVWTSTNVGGKQVETATDGASTTYLYAKGDVLFWVNGDAASAEEAVSGLP
jgi:hypothetical protein